MPVGFGFTSMKVTLLVIITFVLAVHFDISSGDKASKKSIQNLNDVIEELETLEVIL